MIDCDSVEAVWNLGHLYEDYLLCEMVVAFGTANSLFSHLPEVKEIRQDQTVFSSPHLTCTVRIKQECLFLLLISFQQPYQIYGWISPWRAQHIR